MYLQDLAITRGNAIFVNNKLKQNEKFPRKPPKFQVWESDLYPPNREDPP